MLSAVALLSVVVLAAPPLTGAGPAVAGSSESPSILRSAPAALCSAPARRSLIAARYCWPVVPPRVARRFEPPPQRWLAGHRGVDLAAPPGATVRAAGPGRVVYARVLAGRGVVSVAHTGGLRTTYEPVAITVAEGDEVTAGDPLGTLVPGHPGCPETACLHWGLRRGADYLNPLALLGLGRVRLLPLTAA